MWKPAYSPPANLKINKLMNKVKIIVNNKTIELTAKEFVEMWNCTRKMVGWGASGTYGDGEIIIDKKDFSVAKNAIAKIEKVLFTT